MKKKLNLLKFIVVLAVVGLLVAACAPAENDRRFAAGQEPAGAVESQSSHVASPSAVQDVNYELLPTRAACLTPTPAREAGFTDGGELSSGEARTSAAIPPEAVSGARSTGTPPVYILDQVNLGPNIDRSDQAGSERLVGPEAGNESQPGDLAGDSEPGEPTLGRLIAALIGQALGTGEVSVSFDPEPSPIPFPE